MDNLDIRAREEEVSREWEWLHDVIHRVARMRAQHGETQRGKGQVALFTTPHRTTSNVAFSSLLGSAARESRPTGGSGDPAGLVVTRKPRPTVAAPPWGCGTGRCFASSCRSSCD